MAPQILHVLLCVSCKNFQVHIVKKSNKWECKICFTKQTLQQEYGRGSGTECRILVQKLNEARGKIETEVKIAPTYTAKITSVEIGEQERVHLESESVSNFESIPVGQQTKNSKWTVYLDEKENTSAGNFLY